MTELEKLHEQLRAIQELPLTSANYLKILVLKEKIKKLERSKKNELKRFERQNG
jgi:hypothetical protein